MFSNMISEITNHLKGSKKVIDSDNNDFNENDISSPSPLHHIQFPEINKNIVIHYNQSSKDIIENLWLIFNVKSSFLIITEKIIGSSNFGQYVEGFYKDFKVAVKLQTKNSYFFNELYLGYKLMDSGNHSILNPLFAGDYKTGIGYIVYRFVNGVNLNQFISKYRDVLKNKPKLCLNILIEIVKSITMLHENGVIHADLTSKNIILEYVNNDISIFITEFSISKIKESTNLIDSFGNKNYVPEEVLDHGRSHISEKSESFQFSYIIDIFIEILSNQIIKNDLMDLKVKCLDNNPSSRPKFKEIQDLLSQKRNIYYPKVIEV